MTTIQIGGRWRIVPVHVTASEQAWEVQRHGVDGWCYHAGPWGSPGEAGQSLGVHLRHEGAPDDWHAVQAACQGLARVLEPAFTPATGTAA